LLFIKKVSLGTFVIIKNNNMKGVLLVNLGSPESPTPKDVKPYLDEFLMDKYVIDVPFLLRALLVRGIILPNQTKNQLLLTQNMVGRRFAACSYFEKNARKSTKLVDVPVSLAMRYGNPSLLFWITRIA
jgi:ferrochelatase